MDHASLRCVSSYYALKNLVPKMDEIIECGKDLVLSTSSAHRFF